MLRGWICALGLSLCLPVSGCRDAPRDVPPVQGTASQAAQQPVSRVETNAPIAKRKQVAQVKRGDREVTKAPPVALAKEIPKNTSARGPPKQRLNNITVLNYGKPIYTGPIDLRPTIERILRKEKHQHRNDGSVFSNRERRLPQQRRGYYREYVHPTPRMRGAGPQRVVVGQRGDWYYTPDHYASFVPLQ